MKFIKNYRRLLLICCVSLGSLALVSVFVSSCGSPLMDRQVEPRNIYDDRYDDDRDDDRDNNRRSQSNSANCEGDRGGRCSGDADCEEICEDLFSSRKDEDQCKDLSVGEVNDLYTTFDDRKGLLTNPDYEARSSEDELNNVCVDAITTALSIDENFWKDIYDDYSKSEARDVLLWFAQDESIYQALRDGIDAANERNDSDDIDDGVKEFLESLLKKVGTDVIGGLKEELDSEEDNIEDNTFLVYATDVLPRDFLELAHELAQDECVKMTHSTAPTTYNPKFSNARPACVLSKLFCVQDRGTYLFEDESIFESFLEYSDDLENFIEDRFNIEGSDLEDPEIVCPKVRSERI